MPIHHPPERWENSWQLGAKSCKARLKKEIAVLKFCYNSLGDVEGLLKKFANFKKLTHEIINEFIDYIEISEKTSKNEQEIVIHWLF